jgi:hypothetical protein
MFVMVFTNGNLPTNPMCLRECVVPPQSLAVSASSIT